MNAPTPSSLSFSRPTLFPLSTDVVAEEMFGSARPDELIPICSMRPGRLRSQKGRPYIHSFFPLPVADRGDAEQIIETSVALGHEKTFWMAVTLRPEACDREPRWECREQLFSYVQRHVSQIHALFIDLDVGRSPEESKCEFDQMTADEALEGVLRLVEENVIPMPTLTAFSGRGRYLLYLLSEPLDATPSNVRRWRAVVDSFLDRVVHLAPDVGACRTLNRCFKAPGSSGYVVCSMLDDGSGCLRRYGFDEIDAFLLTHPHGGTGVIEPEVERIPYRALAGATRKRRRGGRRSWLQNARPMIVRRNELQRLNVYREGHWPGMRHKLMLYYATAQRRIVYEFFRNDPDKTDTVKAIALRKTLRFNAMLADPLPVEEVAGIFDTMPYKPHRNETIVSELRITKKEMLACGLRSLIPNDVRQRRENEATAKRNAKDRAAWWLDYYVLNLMPVMCISKLMGKDRATVRRYILKVENKLKAAGRVLLPRASLRGHVIHLCSSPSLSPQARSATSPIQVKDATFR